MNKILGSCLLLLSIPALAISKASVNQSWFYPGDEVVLTLSANGNNVIFPNIQQIDGHPVLYTSSSQKIQIVNNQRSRQSSKSFVIKPTSTITIPSYFILVDDDKQATQPLTVALTQPTLAQMGDDYLLSIKASPQEFYLGDEAILEIIFKEKKSITSNQQASIILPEIKGLTFIKTNKSTQSSDESYNIHTINYRVIANNFGQFKLPSVVVSIGQQRNSIFGNFAPVNQAGKLKKIHSNSLTLTVKPLPDDLTIIGDLNINSSIDSATVKQGQAVNLVVNIQGSANFEDIPPFELAIDNATIYSNEAEFTYNQWQQKFAIVGAQDFTIPSLKLDYFDKRSNTKKTLTTEPIDISVIGAKPIANKKINNQPITAKSNGNLVMNNLKYSYLLAGVVIGILFGWLLSIYKNHSPARNQNLIRQIKLARNDKALFDLLLPLNLTELSIILQQLEANIYKNAQYKIRKKDIINVIKSQDKTN